MNFSVDEIEKAKELKRHQLREKTKLSPRRGSFLYGRHCPKGCSEISEGVHLLIDLDESQAQYIWLPTLDECLELSKSLNLNFSLITDYLHRKRFADGREREGLYQLLIERLR